jgi:MFS family permease
MKEYLRVLRENQVIRGLTLIQFIGYFGSWLTNVAIYTLLIELGASPFWIGLASAAHFIFGIILAPFSGVIIDKVEPKKIMNTLLWIEFFTTALFLFVDSLDLVPLFIVLISIRMGASSFYFTTEMSLLPKITSSEDLKIANEMHSSIWSFTYALGLAFGGIALLFISPREMFLLDSIIFLTLIYLLSKVEIEVTIVEKSLSFIQSMKEGLKYIFSNKRVIYFILLHSIVGVTVFEPIVAVATKKEYSLIVAVPIALALIHSLRAISLVVGSILFSKYVNKNNFHYLLIYQAFALLFWGFVMEDLYLSILGSILNGLVIALIWSYTYTLLQEEVEQKFYGRVIAYNDMLFLAVSSLTAIATGRILEAGYPYLTIFIFSGSIFFISAFLVKKLLKNGG